MLLEQPKYKLGLQAVCRMYYISLRYNNTEESDDEHIILSYKYVAQRAMESACRWVNAINYNIIIHIQCHILHTK